MPNGYKLEAIPNYGDHMTKESFVGSVEDNFFTDYDGSGYYATDKEMSNVRLDLSVIARGGFDQRFTHVVWFNK